ncbi:transglutaminase-like domain-containing protein [Salipiger mucosus]|uniref:Transglutaminase-like domain-containing protein n=1 Tax=Salipiger mucosus DSM 16094 TaxID=1123237 RepID=S9Q4C3_9RHOB|nr:transglutaminase family protein [Salipiger mucosus]EPX76176.1 hypothetical protein Salmuc_01959 [Salipiger mucosus DSM 16094]
MTLTRRSALKLGAAAVALAGAPRLAQAAYAPRPDGWRRFELTTRVAVPRDGKTVEVWVPVPSVTEDDWMRAGDTAWQSDAEEVTLRTDEASGARYVHAVWPEGEGEAVIQIVSTAAAQDRSTDFDAPGNAAPLTPEERERFTSATERGLGDIASMLEMGDLTGKCADLNALYVGLARAAGLPARDVYGLRVAPSAFGYKSLGAGSSNVTKAQHCRAEVYLEDHGWIPVDPADVRKVVLEEPPKTLELGDPEVHDVREALFGAWEGNWLAYNFAHDVSLQGMERDEIPFLMYPMAEVGGEELDELDPDSFAYTITARELSV